MFVYFTARCCPTCITLEVNGTLDKIQHILNGISLVEVCDVSEQGVTEICPCMPDRVPTIAFYPDLIWSQNKKMVPIKYDPETYTGTFFTFGTDVVLDALKIWACNCVSQDLMNKSKKLEKHGTVVQTYPTLDDDVETIIIQLPSGPAEFKKSN